jgi:transposase
MFSEELWMILRALHRQGWSIAALAREFNLNRRTVRRYVDTDLAPGYAPRACPADLNEAQLAHVVRRLGVCGTLRATTLYREVTELGYAGSYPSFARRVRGLRQQQHQEPTIRFETDPGVQTQMDWCDLGAWPLGAEIVELKALVGILGFSRHVAVRFAIDQTRATTLELVPWVLHELGGATEEILTDRDAVFVIGETSDKRAIFAPEWVDLTMTLSTSPRACRAYRAKTKGKVERVVREVKEDLLPWLTGQGLPPRPSLYDYDELARRWATEVVATRRHRTTRAGRVRSVDRGAAASATDPGPVAGRGERGHRRHVQRHRPRRGQGQGRGRVAPHPR